MEGENGKVLLAMSEMMYKVNIYLFEVNNRNTRKWSEICSKLTIKTPKLHH